MMGRRFLIGFLILAFLLFSNANSFAFADDLVIQSDGSIDLIITDNSVLGDSTPTPKAPTPPPPSRTIPLVPAKTESKVDIKPPINNDKKVQVTITPTPKAPATAQAQTQAPVRSPSITRTVDQVVAQGANGQPVLTIKSDKASNLTIKQEDTQVSTQLPIQIDTATHQLSVPSGNADNESTKIQVLPKEAVKEIKDRGILDTKGLVNTKIDLTKDVSGINYTVTSGKKGKLFGVLDVKTLAEVKLSAENGKITKNSQTPFFGILNALIK